MQTFISKYGLAAHLALLAVTPLFLYPFCSQGTTSVALLWMSLLGAVWIVMEPSRRNDEMLHEARVRVRGAIVRDPLFWLLVLLVCFAAVRLWNGDIFRLYDGRAAKWVLSEPKSTLLPRAAEGAGFAAFSLVVALTVVLTGCRQALGKSARIALVSMVSFLTGVFALTVVIACKMGHEGALALAGAVGGVWPEGGIPVDSALWVSGVGHVLGLAALGAVVSAAGLFECKWNSLLLFFAFSVGATLVGLFYFATPATQVLYGVLWCVAVLGCAVYLAVTQRLNVLFRYGVVLVLACAVPALAVLAIAPKEMTDFHWQTLPAGLSLADLFPVDFWTRRTALSEAARTFWQESPWLGCGIGSFVHNLWLSGASRVGLVSEAPLNAWWQLLAERGMIGVLTVALPFCFMTATFAWRILRALGRHVFLPLPVLGVVGVVAAVTLSLVDCSCWRADSLLVTGAFYALAASSFPAPRKRVEDEDAVT